CARWNHGSFDIC
nr:immunoglobulin heavy chain junction region [Macaca mulatta]